MSGPNGEPEPTTPSEGNGEEGRDDLGRFAPGNKLGKGNPHANLIAGFRMRWLQVAKTQDVEKAYKFLVNTMNGVGDDGKDADIAYNVRLMACDKFLDRTIGKPVVAVDLTGDVGETFAIVREGLERLSGRFGQGHKRIDLG